VAGVPRGLGFSFEWPLECACARLSGFPAERIRALADALNFPPAMLKRVRSDFEPEDR